MKRLLLGLALGVCCLTCKAGDSASKATSSQRHRPSTTTEPPLKTFTMDEEAIVPLKEEAGRAERRVGLACSWARIWETPGPRPMPVGGMIKPPKKLEDVPPVLPYRKTATKGTPVLEVIIGTDGRVSEVRILQSFDPSWPEGDAALIQAVRQWRYEPTIVDGKAIPLCTKITMSVEWTELSREK